MDDADLYLGFFQYFSQDDWFVVFYAPVCLYRKRLKNFDIFVLGKGSRLVFVALGDFSHQLIFVGKEQVDVFTNDLLPRCVFY